MPAEISIPTGDAKLDSFMSTIVLKRFPKAKLYEKNTSALMKVIYYGLFMWIWQRRFLVGYHTTLGQNVYVSKTTCETKDWGGFYYTMRHEFIHMLQSDKWKILYSLSYVSPQVLASLALLSILSIWFGKLWLLNLLWLLMLTPIPAPWRTKWETEGYTATMITIYEERNDIPQASVDSIIKQFTSSSYFYMCPFKSYITNKINSIVDGIKAGNIKGVFLGYPVA